MGYARIRQQTSKSTIIMTAKNQPCESNCACGEVARTYLASPRGINTGLLKVTSPSHHSPVAQPDQIAFVNQVAALNRILDDNVHLAVWRQTNAPKFVTALSDPSIEPENLPAFEGMVLPGMVAAEMKKYLWVPYQLRSHELRKRALDEEGIDELVHHIEQLVEVFADISQQAGFVSNDNDGGQLPFVYVKLQVIGDDSCKYWHQDSVPFRMITTYRGPCTEWVPPALSKETLERRQFDSEHVQSLSHCDVALFKGRGDADADLLYDQTGIVHRSPRTEGSGIYRLVLVLDIPRGWHFDD
mmetsp:Transcript_12864/g.20927  ORF Transcript_12864/g.20927 Transcript_12864/m.20927 type:complete len:300 (-) Transcript_12864:41-940(-)